MELSIPIITYPGRGGNSKPFVLNYSSKVWNMKMFNARSQMLQVSNPAYSFLAHQSTEIRPNFAEKSAAGWTSSLQPAIIYGEPLSEVYNEFGSLYTGQVSGGFSSLANLTGNGECHQEITLAYSFACNGLAWQVTQTCTCNMGDDGCYIPPIPPQECVANNPIFNPGGPGTNNPGNSLPPTYVPQIPHVVKRVSVMTPDGVTHELRKSDKAYNCNNEPTECYGASSSYGTYLAVDGSGLRLVMGESQFGAVRDVLYFPGGGKYLFTPYTQPNQPPSTTPEKFVDADGNESIYGFDGKWIDTMSREIKNPFSSPFPHDTGTQDLQVKRIE